MSRWLLAAISSLSPFGISIMVPLVPMLSISLDRSVSDLQYLFSIYVIGLAVSQPLFGLVTDRIGRRTVLLGGFAVFVGASILLIFVDTLGAMIFLRFIQAVGVGVGTVVARGLIRDHLPPDEALKAFALLTAAMGFTPVIAPVVGGYLASLLGMASVFVVLALLGAGLLLLCVKSIPHDGPVDRDEGQAASLKGYLSLLRSLRFWGHAGAFGFLQGMVFTLLATGSVLFQDQFGLSMEGFSLVWGSSALVYVFGSFLLSHLSSPGHAAMAASRRAGYVTGVFQRARADRLAGTDTGRCGDAPVQLHAAVGDPHTHHDVWRGQRRAALERQRGGSLQLGRDDYGRIVLVVGRHTLRDRARADHGVFWWSRHRFCALLVVGTSRGMTAIMHSATLMQQRRYPANELPNWVGNTEEKT
ncbi:MAG: hypothetical protein CM15mP74_30510 [Halieaceae bacterium]|nr:MAG: hypothetical protein CM15mP74_30510 [Halieaceae bacterium]